MFILLKLYNLSPMLFLKPYHPNLDATQIVTCVKTTKTKKRVDYEKKIEHKKEKVNKTKKIQVSPPCYLVAQTKLTLVFLFLFLCLFVCVL